MKRVLKQFHGNDCEIEGVRHKFIEREQDGTVRRWWNFTYAEEHYLVEKVATNKNRIRIAKHCVDVEKVHFHEQDGEKFLVWPEYIDCLRCYMKEKIDVCFYFLLLRTLSFSIRRKRLAWVSSSRCVVT
jgi:hypothetical protein